MTPTDRDGLIELMARGICRERIKSNMRMDGRQMTDAEVERAIDYGVSEHTEWLPFAQATLAAIESHGLAIVPIEATEGMLKQASDECEFMLHHTMYTAMLNASPYAEKLKATDESGAA